MPNGKPNFELIRYMKPIVHMDKRRARVMVFMLIKSFCDSVNVVRNMSEDQMIKAAAFLVDDCGDFRMEDYLMMFTMLERGQLVKIMDRVDITLIGEAIEAYWAVRNKASKAIENKPIQKDPIQSDYVSERKIREFMTHFIGVLEKRINSDKEKLPNIKEEEERRLRLVENRKRMIGWVISNNPIKEIKDSDIEDEG